MKENKSDSRSQQKSYERNIHKTFKKDMSEGKKRSTSDGFMAKRVGSTERPQKKVVAKIYRKRNQFENKEGETHFKM